MNQRRPQDLNGKETHQTYSWPSSLSDIHFRFIREPVSQRHIRLVEEIRSPGCRCLGGHICKPRVNISHLRHIRGYISKECYRVEKEGQRTP